MFFLDSFSPPRNKHLDRRSTDTTVCEEKLWETHKPDHCARVSHWLLLNLFSCLSDYFSSSHIVLIVLVGKPTCNGRRLESSRIEDVERSRITQEVRWTLLNRVICRRERSREEIFILVNHRRYTSLTHINSVHMIATCAHLVTIQYPRALFLYNHSGSSPSTMTTSWSKQAIASV